MTKHEGDKSRISALAGFFLSKFDWILTCGTVALLPLLIVQANNLWHRPQYQFFPFSYLVFLYLLLSRGSVSSTNSKGRTVIGKIANSLAMVLILIAALRFSPWIAHLASICLIFGWMMLRLRESQWHAICAWTAVIAVTVPLPFNLDSKLVQLLQSVSATSASMLIDLSAIPHLQKGNVLLIEQKELFVDQACSGIDSLYALTAVTVILIAIQRVPFVVSLLTIVFIPVWAWTGNVTRLYTIVFAMHTWEIDLSEGWQHTVLGLIVFLLVFLGVMSTMRFVGIFLKPLGFGKEWSHKLYDRIMYWPGRRKTSTSPKSTDLLESEQDAPPSAPSVFSAAGANRDMLKANWLSVASCLLMFTCGAAASGKALGIGPWRKTTLVSQIDKGSVESILQQATLPQKVGNISIEGFEITHREQNALMGEFSAIWHGRDGNFIVHLSLDFPFADRHYLEQCFVQTGSSISEVADYETLGENGPEYTRDAILMDQLEQSTYITYCIFLENGQTLREHNPLLQRLFPTQLDGLVFQIQINVSNPAGLNEGKKAEYRRLLLDLKKLLIPTIQRLGNE